jgi:hypothetical protein
MLSSLMAKAILRVSLWIEPWLWICFLAGAASIRIQISPPIKNHFDHTGCLACTSNSFPEIPDKCLYLNHSSVDTGIERRGQYAFFSGLAEESKLSSNSESFHIRWFYANDRDGRIVCYRNELAVP